MNTDIDNMPSEEQINQARRQLSEIVDYLILQQDQSAKDAVINFLKQDPSFESILQQQTDDVEIQNLQSIVANEWIFIPLPDANVVRERLQQWKTLKYNCDFFVQTIKVLNYREELKKTVTFQKDTPVPNFETLDRGYTELLNALHHGFFGNLKIAFKSANTFEEACTLLFGMNIKDKEDGINISPNSPNTLRFSFRFVHENALISSTSWSDVQKVQALIKKIEKLFNDYFNNREWAGWDYSDPTKPKHQVRDAIFRMAIVMIRNTNRAMIDIIKKIAVATSALRKQEKTAAEQDVISKQKTVTPVVPIK